ncbi:hypothetical protein LINPERPRIM_LOCUS18559 [Linum perenne]
MAEWSKAPDSSSGLRKRAWVQIPLLTFFLHHFSYHTCDYNVTCSNPTLLFGSFRFNFHIYNVNWCTFSTSC